MTATTPGLTPGSLHSPVWLQQELTSWREPGSPVTRPATCGRGASSRGRWGGCRPRRTGSAPASPTSGLRCGRSLRAPPSAGEARRHIRGRREWARAQGGKGWAAAHLPDEGDDPLRPVFIHVWQVDLVTEQHQPLAQLHGGQHHPVRRAPVLAVVVEGLQQQLWGGGAGEVKAHNLREGSQLPEEQGRTAAHGPAAPRSPPAPLPPCRARHGAR